MATADTASSPTDQTGSIAARSLLQIQDGEPDSISELPYEIPTPASVWPPWNGVLTSSTISQRGEDWVILAGDRNQARSIVKMKTDEDKMRVVGSHQVIAFNGEAGQSDPSSMIEYRGLRKLMMCIQATRPTLQNTFKRT